MPIINSGLRRCVLFAAVLLATASVWAQTLDEVWMHPPREARLKAYWWWLNGNVTRESITRDLEQMKAKGFGGAVIFDANGANQDGNASVPHGPTFASTEWRALFKHSLREADRLGLEMSLNIQSGWNLGGPTVGRDDAPKKLVWTEILVTNKTDSIRLHAPKGRDGFFRDLFVLAWRVKSSTLSKTGVVLPRPLQNQRQKALLAPLKPSSAPDSSTLFQELEPTPDEGDFRLADLIDLTSKLKPDGVLDWDVPNGIWKVQRIGFTLNDHCRVSTSSDGWQGYALDPFDAGAFRRYWDAVVEPLLEDAKPYAGKALKYLHTDSWEVEVANWTPTLREEFQKRRGYDLLPWLPVITGSIVKSREESNRFLNDFRRTMGDLAIDNHYRLMRDGAHQHGLLIHPESGGPHAVPIDAQQCLGFNDAPMSEFWASAWRHRVGDQNRFFIKQPASAAHTYGRKLVMAEGFTTVGPHWQETLWDNLKPSFDHAVCEGLNMLVWCSWVSSPEEMGLPGQQLFAGTHLNANVTWWQKSAPVFDYLNRCQALMQQGVFVADVAYYYGSHVPNFARLKSSDPARILPGYDYDVVTDEVILSRMSVKDGRLMLPDGMSYRLLVLPNRDHISLSVLRKLHELVCAGATIIGPRPAKALSLKDFPQNDQEVDRLGLELWNGKPGRGRVVSDRTAREVLLADGTHPDFEFKLNTEVVDYIHRRTKDADIYFVASRTNQPVQGKASFRVSGKVPELWNPVTGERQVASAYKQADGRTEVPLAFDPCGSWVIVFRDPATRDSAVAQSGGSETKELMAITGNWTVSFDPKWGGPETVEFPDLISWAERPEPGIRYYSGTAVYSKTFSLPELDDASRIMLDLGEVHELAEVRVNGKPCGVTWTPPFRVDVTDAIRSGSNQLEIEVVNFWPNRLIGDAKLPPGQRRTRTNITKFDQPKGDEHYTNLMPSGLLGPIKLIRSLANGGH